MKIKTRVPHTIPVSIIEWNKCLEMEFQSSLRIQCFGSMPSFKTSVFAKDDHQGWTANCCQFRWNNMDIIDVFPKKEKFCFPAKYIGIKPSYSWRKKEPPLLKWQLSQLLIRPKAGAKDKNKITSCSISVPHKSWPKAGAKNKNKITSCSISVPHKSSKSVQRWPYFTGNHGI